MSDSILELKHISKHFGGIKALHDVSFTIPRGGVHALVGENGAGKSTLIKICSGVHQPDTGEVLLRGQPVTFSSPQDSQAAGISVVHQEIPICPHMTVAENIFLGRPLPKSGGLINWGQVNREAKSFFERFQADVSPTDIAGRLPIAKQQMVEIAQALSLDAEIIIMDEPTSALGKKETDQLFQIIHELTEQGITVIYVSHRLEEVFEISDYVTALRDGQYINTAKIEDVSPDDVVEMMVGREINNLFPKEYNAQATAPLLKVRNLSVPEQFDNVNFELFPGEVLGLVGLQGSGTSEVMRALFGSISNVSGEIIIRDEAKAINDPADAIRQGIAYVPADRKGEGLFLNMSVRDNNGILILKKLVQMFPFVSNQQLNQQAHHAVDKFGVRTGSIFQAINSLSGGNQQKIVVSKSLATEPLIVLLDDPTRGVDVGAKAEIHQIINQLTAEGNAIILVSSELPEVLEMSDRILVMYKGQVIATMPHEEIDRDTVMGMATGVQVTKQEAVS